jgi:hypothetical protein
MVEMTSFRALGSALGISYELMSYRIWLKPYFPYLSAIYLHNDLFGSVDSVDRKSSSDHSVGYLLLSGEKDRIDLTQLTVGDIVTKVKDVSERLVEDNVSQLMTRLANRLDEFAHVAGNDPWRSELAFIAMVIGVSGVSLGRELKDASPLAKKEALDSVKTILSKVSESLTVKNWDQVHNGLRDLYSVVHRVERNI